MDFEKKRNLELEEAIKNAGFDSDHSINEYGQGEYLIHIGDETYYVMAGAVPENIWRLID